MNPITWLTRLFATRTPREKIMGQFEDLVTEMNDATNKIAARLDALTSQLQSSQGQAPSAETMSQFKAISEQLKAMGQNPQQPIPPVADDAQAPNA